MRLKCPNCGAEYEVDSAMIPNPGRDVQCAACGHGWFQEAEGAPGDGAVMLDALQREQTAAKAASPRQTDNASEPDQLQDRDHPPADQAAPEADAEPTAAPVPDAEPAPTVSQNADPATDYPAAPSDSTAAPNNTTKDDATDVLADGDEGEKRPSAPKPEGPGDISQPGGDAGTAAHGTLLTPDRRSLDPDVRRVLEEEATRERNARAAESQPLDSQPDLGLDDLDESDFARPTPPKPDLPEDEAELPTPVAAAVEPAGQKATAETAAAAAIPVASATLARPAASAGDRLPDIEEINSTLRSTAERDPKQDAAVVTEDVRSNKRGFRLGFSLMLFAMTLAILAYLFAPQLADTLPALRDPLARYVDQVNTVRDGVDQLMARGADWLGG